MKLSKKVGLQLISLFYIASITTADNNRYHDFITEWIMVKDSYPGLLQTIYKNELVYFSFRRPLTITSMDPGFEKQIIPGAYLLRKIYFFGNGKILTTDDKIGQYIIIDPKVNSSNPIVEIKKDYNIDDKEKEIISVITYEDTFDIFSRFQNYCNPCRYNDKGESIEVANSTFKESIDQLFPTIEKFGNITEGYLYMDKCVVLKDWKYLMVTNLKIVDSKFHILREREILEEVRSHSSAYGNITICYTINTSPIPKILKERVVSEFLDTELNTTLQLLMYNHSEGSEAQWKVKYISIHNLPDGGAMVAMDFIKYSFGKQFNRNYIIVQRIKPDGRIDQPIKFDTIETEQLYFIDFVFDNGQYCLTVVSIKSENFEKKRWIHTKCTG